MILFFACIKNPRVWAPKKTYMMPSSDCNYLRILLECPSPGSLLGRGSKTPPTTKIQILGEGV